MVTPACHASGMDTNTSAPLTRPSSPRGFRTPVRGHAFASRPGSVPDPQPGQPALLLREPGNPADALAVAVWVEDGTVPWRIGYLDRGVSARIAPRLDRGQQFTAWLDGWIAEPEGRWRRPLLLLRADPASAPADPVPTDLHLPAGWGRPPGVVRRRLPRRA